MMQMLFYFIHNIDTKFEQFYRFIENKPRDYEVDGIKS